MGWGLDGASFSFLHDDGEGAPACVDDEILDGEGAPACVRGQRDLGRRGSCSCACVRMRGCSGLLLRRRGEGAPACSCDGDDEGGEMREREEIGANCV